MASRARGHWWRHRGFWLLPIVAVALASCGGKSEITVRDAWTRPARAAMDHSATPGMNHSAIGSMMSGTNSVVYLTIANRGDGEDTLTAVTTDVASTVQIHRTEIKDNVASMRQVREVAIPAHGELAFDPNGYHLILINVTRDLKVGDTIELTLTFKQAGPVRTSAQVRDQ